MLFIALSLSLVSCGAFGDASDTSKEKEPVSDGAPVVNTSVTVQEGSEGGKKKIDILVLGDSIARGYGLEDVDKERFSAILKDMLSNESTEVSVANYGIDGLTGAELVTKLQDEDISELSDCDYVIISIGGNNILGQLQNLLGMLVLPQEFDPSVFSEYFSYVFSGETDSERAAYVRDMINELIKSVCDVFESEEFRQMVVSAGESLREEIPAIVSAIREKNPDAKILLQTVYNPYGNISISLPGIEAVLDMSKYGEFAVSSLNEAILSLAEENGYTVAQVHEEFERSDKPLTNAGINLGTAQFSVDPHPNADGHKKIANIYYKIIKEG